MEQECIPVGCVPSAAVAVCWMGGVCLSACWDTYCLPWPGASLGPGPVDPPGPGPRDPPQADPQIFLVGMAWRPPSQTPPTSLWVSAWRLALWTE